jgi:acyl-CoA reductase-like NAD-dependent aldehyde dehydrogenase
MKKPKLLEKYQLFIDGQWKDASDGGTFATTCPADGEHLADCAEATKSDVDAAVDAAWRAFGSWKNVAPAQRANMLMKIADIIDANTEHLALVESCDNGKPIRETLRADVPLASDHFRYFASAIRAEEGSATMLNNNTISLVLREPIGVVGQIVPWNFPFLIGSWKLAPVLAAGCCTVFKPSSHTSLSVLELARLIQDVLPPGVFNVVTGKGSKSGQYILDHEGFRKFSFTGSTDVGYSVALAAAKKLIPSTLELGGKSANIYFPDCQWDLAIDGLQRGILFNQGQVCCAGSRVFVHEDIHDRFVADAAAAFKKIKIGMPWEPDAQMGSLVYEAHLDAILKGIEEGKKEGAKVVCGGERYKEGEFIKGCFMQPTLLAGVNNKMKVAQEEIFGPIAVIIKFKTEEEVIAMANDNKYGLAGAVWTHDLNRAFRVCKGIETGRMWVNTYNSTPAGSPFGGCKQSGFGRETHKVILEHYTQMKNIIINLGESPSGLYPA